METTLLLVQVFVTKIPVTLKESEVQPVFEAFGQVDKVVLFRANPRDMRTKVPPALHRQPHTPALRSDHASL